MFFPSKMKIPIVLLALKDYLQRATKGKQPKLPYSCHFLASAELRIKELSKSQCCTWKGKKVCGDFYLCIQQIRWQSHPQSWAGEQLLPFSGAPVVWNSTRYDIKRSKYASSVKFGVFQSTCLISSARRLPALALTFSQLCAQQKWLFHLRDLGKRLNLQTLSPNLTRRLLGTNLSRFLAASIAPLCPAREGEVELLASFF